MKSISLHLPYFYDNINYLQPNKQMITIYKYEKETMELYSFKADLPVGIHEGFTLNTDQ